MLLLSELSAAKLKKKTIKLNNTKTYVFEHESALFEKKRSSKMHSHFFYKNQLKSLLELISAVSC